MSAAQVGGPNFLLDLLEREEAAEIIEDLELAPDLRRVFPVDGPEPEGQHGEASGDEVPDEEPDTG